jgi:hypothetical protein
VSAAAPRGAYDLGLVLEVLARDAIEVDEADLHRPTLDDAFFALTGARGDDAPADPDLLEARP